MMRCDGTMYRWLPVSASSAQFGTMCPPFIKIQSLPADQTMKPPIINPVITCTKLLISLLIKRSYVSPQLRQIKF